MSIKMLLHTSVKIQHTYMMTFLTIYAYFSQFKNFIFLENTILINQIILLCSRYSLTLFFVFS
jgi:hypothetical protein